MLSRLDAMPVARREVKDALIRTLMKTCPLNARTLYLEIKKNHTSSISYQGVHKALGQLCEQQIVSEEKRLYSLNPDWVDHLKRFASDLETSFVKKRPASILDLPIYGSAAFENTGVLVEPYFWMLDQTHKIWSKCGPVRGAFFTRRAYPLIVMANKEYAQFMDAFKDKDQYVLVRENKPADQFFIKIWEKYGFSCKLGVDCAKNCDSYVCGDFIFQIFHPKETDALWDTYYAMFDQDSSLDVTVAHKVAFEIKTPSKFVFTRNPEYAEQLRKEAKSQFTSSGVKI
ncbi:hypothetical protein HY994_05345 [Candidatus Micrarchaeota archaeon]|nr:hypothetical protein [Candidatus Micrarchaeota archaeon]